MTNHSRKVDPVMLLAHNDMARHLNRSASTIQTMITARSLRIPKPICWTGSRSLWHVRDVDSAWNGESVDTSNDKCAYAIPASEIIDMETAMIIMARTRIVTWNASTFRSGITHGYNGYPKPLKSMINGIESPIICGGAYIFDAREVRSIASKRARRG